MSPASTPASSLATRCQSVPLSWPACPWPGAARVRLASFAVFVSSCLVVTLTDHYIGLLSVLLLFSLYSLAAHSRRRDAVVGLLVCLCTFIGLAVLDVPDLGTSDLLQACALLLTAWALGDAIRSRRAEQSERLRMAEQEAVTARELAARAVAEERLRIARELHDVIAHSMSLIAVQAGVGGHVIRSDVAAAEHALEIIAETSRKALTQTRWMLGLLREEDTDVAASPVHTIDDLDGLVRDVRQAGIDVALTVEGPVRPLDGGDRADGVPHRAGIVDQRAQALERQAGAGAGDLCARTGWTSRSVMLVEAGRDLGAGRGCRAGTDSVGLRERTRLLGGALEYGALEGAGFRVAAHLPSSMEAAS